MARNLCTESVNLEQNCSPLSERRLAGHPQRGIYLLTRMSEVPSAVNSAAKTVGVHVCASAEPIHEEYDIGVSPRCDRKGPEVIDANRDTRAGRQGEREDGSTYRLSARRSRLALYTTTKPPSRADAHANPPIKAFGHRERTSDTAVAGGVSMARLHNPRTHEQRDVDSRRFLV